MFDCKYCTRPYSPLPFFFQCLFPYLHGAWRIKINIETIEQTKIKNTRNFGRIIVNREEEKILEKKKYSHNSLRSRLKSDRTMQHSYQITTSIQLGCSATPRNNQLCNINLHRERNLPNKLSPIFHLPWSSPIPIIQHREIRKISVNW